MVMKITNMDCLFMLETVFKIQNKKTNIQLLLMKITGWKNQKVDVYIVLEVRVIESQRDMIIITTLEKHYDSK